MTDRDALLRAICENPADDAPRLVYADWLEEHGRAEDAEFIRVQVELARLGHDDGFHTDEAGRLRQVPTDFERLTERQLELWFDGWGRPALPVAMGSWPIFPHPVRGQLVLVRRGFVDCVACRYDEFTAVSALLFALQPVSVVRLVDREPLRDRYDDVYVWDCIRPGDRNPRPSQLPAVIVNHLFDLGTPTFNTLDEAEAALSWACVRLGRTQARLE